MVESEVYAKESEASPTLFLHLVTRVVCAGTTVTRTRILAVWVSR